jgi:quinol monooxygenase YgiN
MQFVLWIMPLLIVAAIVGGEVAAQEKEHPIVTTVKANVKDPSKPFTMLVHIKIKDGAAAQFEMAFARAITETRKEKGNLVYQLNRSAKSPNEYIVYERWRDVAALQAHVTAPHIQALFAATGELRAGPPQVDVLVPVGE